MSWAALLGLSAGCYALKALGPVVLGAREPGPRMQSVLRLLAVPLLAALVATQTVADGTEPTLDARVPALVVAAVLVWRRASFLLVVLAAAATAAGLRLL